MLAVELTARTEEDQQEFSFKVLSGPFLSMPHDACP